VCVCLCVCVFVRVRVCESGLALLFVCGAAAALFTVVVDVAAVVLHGYVGAVVR
jgi:hypothetical protein